RDLHPFPTRRSSDLDLRGLTWIGAWIAIEQPTQVDVHDVSALAVSQSTSYASRMRGQAKRFAVMRPSARIAAASFRSSFRILFAVMSSRGSSLCTTTALPNGTA